jgi:hypothetical protein
VAKINYKSAWLLRYAYSRRPHLLCTRHMANVRGLEKAGLLRQTSTPSLFEVTEEGELWIQDHPEKE